VNQSLDKVEGDDKHEKLHPKRLAKQPCQLLQPTHRTLKHPECRKQARDQAGEQDPEIVAIENQPENILAKL
jgi:hypothetical protein